MMSDAVRPGPKAARDRISEVLMAFPDGTHAREIAARAGLAESTVRFELSLMAEDGTVSRAKDGRAYAYRLQPHPVRGRRAPDDPPCGHCRSFYRRETDEECGLHPQASRFWRARRPVRLDSLGETEAGAIRFLLGLFADHGWKDCGGTALAITRRLAAEDPHGLAPSAVAALVPLRFYSANGCTRAEFERAVAGLKGAGR